MGLFNRISGKESKISMVKVKDPVCGMEIDPEKTAAKSECGDQTYYFYSAGCKKSFDASSKNME